VLPEYVKAAVQCSFRNFLLAYMLRDFFPLTNDLQIYIIKYRVLVSHSSQEFDLLIFQHCHKSFLQLFLSRKLNFEMFQVFTWVMTIWTVFNLDLDSSPFFMRPEYVICLLAIWLRMFYLKSVSWWFLKEFFVFSKKRKKIFDWHFWMGRKRWIDAFGYTFLHRSWQHSLKKRSKKVRFSSSSEAQDSFPEIITQKIINQIAKITNNIIFTLALFLARNTVLFKNLT